MSILLIFLYKFNTIPIKFSAGNFVDINKFILQFTWKWEEPKIAKSILIKNKPEGLMLRSKYKALALKSV